MLLGGPFPKNANLKKDQKPLAKKKRTLIMHAAFLNNVTHDFISTILNRGADFTLYLVACNRKKRNTNVA